MAGPESSRELQVTRCFEVKGKRIRQTTINRAQKKNSGSNRDMTAVHAPHLVIRR